MFYIIIHILNVEPNKLKYKDHSMNNSPQRAKWLDFICSVLKNQLNKKSKNIDFKQFTIKMSYVKVT